MMSYQSLYICLLLVLPLSQAWAEKIRIRRIDETFFMERETREKYQKFILSAEDRENDLVTSLSDISDDAFKAHSCPHTYVQRYNRNRRPQITIEAHCSQQECLNTNLFRETAQRRRVFPSRSSGSKCMEVFYYRWVKVRKQNRAGKKKFQRRLLPVPVACSCTRDSL